LRDHVAGGDHERGGPVPRIGGESGNDHQGARAQRHQNQGRQEQTPPRTDPHVLGENDPSLRIAGRHLIEVLHDLPAVGTATKMSFDQGRL